MFVKKMYMRVYYINMKKILNFFKKSHRYLGLILLPLLILFSISGIFLNHREIISDIEINRNFLPKEYKFENWNNFSLRSIVFTEEIDYYYGEIGVFGLKKGDDESKLFPVVDGLGAKSSDNIKVNKLIQSKIGNKNLYCGTINGLFTLDIKKETWEKVELDIPTFTKVIDILEINSSLYVLTRSEVLKSDFNFKDKSYSNFNKIDIPFPVGDDFSEKVTLFNVFWFFHSGEIFGFVGKLFVDLLGLVMIFLSLSGLMFYFFPKFMKRKVFTKKRKSLRSGFKFSQVWHNKLAIYFVFFLLITSITGIFLRPPFIVLVIDTKIDPIKYTHLENSNFWHDKFRKFIYLEKIDSFLISTADGFYRFDASFKSNPQKIDDKEAPLVSVMSVNLLENYKNVEQEDKIIVGSFSGLFLWDVNSGEITDFNLEQRTDITNFDFKNSKYLVAGYFSTPSGEQYLIDYNKGIKKIDLSLDSTSLNKNKDSFKQPKYFEDNSFISLWNLSLEFHTARIYQIIFGGFYILIVPIVGFLTTLMLLSGIIIWFYRNKRKKL